MNSTIESLQPRKRVEFNRSPSPSGHQSISSTIPSPSVKTSLPRRIGEGSPRCFAPTPGVMRAGHGSSPSISAAWLFPYPWYEGPNPPLGYTFYNARWRTMGLPAPLYTIAGDTEEDKKRRQRFWTKINSILTLKAFVMSLAVCTFHWSTTKSKKNWLQTHYPRLFVGNVSTVAVVVFFALCCSTWRRKRRVRTIVMSVNSVLFCCLAVAATSALDVSMEHYINTSSLDACIGLTQLAVSLLLVLLFSLQTGIELSTWAGCIIVMILHMATDYICTLLYFALLPTRVLASIKVSVFFGVIAAWVYTDTRRMTWDVRTAVTEEEGSFATFQLYVDILYVPWYLWELLRLGSGSLIGYCSGARRKTITLSRKLDSPSKKSAVLRSRRPARN